MTTILPAMRTPSMSTTPRCVTAQQEGLHLNVNDKLKIARYLDELGVSFIEGGWPGANPNDTAFFAAAADGALSLQSAKLVAFGATRRRAPPRRRTRRCSAA